MAKAYNHSIWDVEVKKKIQNFKFILHSAFKANLSYMKPCLKQKVFGGSMSQVFIVIPCHRKCTGNNKYAWKITAYIAVTSKKQTGSLKTSQEEYYFIAAYQIQWQCI